ncbi:hypothetical protein [Roseimicrobium gellanilyticum]|nr:hypothetical protein [Roseimicrobium gellanilyticum]
MSERYFLMSLGLPVICHELAFWLWIWLVLRIVPLHQLLSLFVVLITPIAQVRSLYCPVAATIPSQDFSLYWAFMPLIPALLHLAVEPARAGLKRLDQTPMNIRLFWIFTAALPAFFVWFTICRYFTRRERVIAWSWAAIHTTFFLVVYPHAVFLSPLSVLMAFVALQQWWSERSKADSDDSA